MSVETNSVPPWKLELLERKRRQEEDYRRKQESADNRLSQMPAWKRDILIRKQQQKNSMVFLRKPPSPDRSCSESEESRRISSSSLPKINCEVPNHQPVVTSPGSLLELSISTSDTTPSPIAEAPHITPITRNPLVQNDPKFKTTKYVRHSTRDSAAEPSGYNGSLSETDGQPTSSRNSAICDEVFTEGEEEVAYGRGFVHRLLQRFSHMSTKEDKSPSSDFTRRASSTENLLEGRLSPHGYATSPLSPSRTRSSESLVSPVALSPRGTASTENSLSHDTCSNTSNHSSHVEDEVDSSHNASTASSENIVEEMPRSNIVRTARSVFESISHSSSIPCYNGKSSIPVSPSSAKAPIPVFPGVKAAIPVSPSSVKAANKPDFSSYNDTLSRKAAGSAAVQLENHEIIYEDVAQSPIDDVKSIPPVAVVTEPSPVSKLYISGATEKKEQKPVENHEPLSPREKKEPSSPKKSFLYPGSMSKGSESNKENWLVNGIEGNNGDVLSKRKAPPIPGEHVNIICIDNNVDESHTDPVVNDNHSSEALTVSNKNDVRKMDQNRPNLSLNLESSKSIPSKERDVIRTRNERNKKRPAPTGPGSMLIRPASNLVVGSTNTEYLNLTKFNDVKRGEFAPARKRLSSEDEYYDYDDDDDDVPVTNIDDVLDNIPVTDIDNLTASDANENVVKKKKYDFIGGNVRLSRSLLQKTRPGKKPKLCFAEGSPSLYEYPSEQYLIEHMQPEPGDLDFNKGINKHQHRHRGDSTSSDEGDDSGRGAPSKPLSAPSLAVGNTSGSLSSYRSKLGMEYELGQHQEEYDPEPAPPPSPQDELNITPADTDNTWSDSQTADILF